MRESDLWHHLFRFSISLSKMMSGLWQRSVECVTPRVEWCQNRPGKMINLMFLYFSGHRVRSSCYHFFLFFFCWAYLSNRSNVKSLILITLDLNLSQRQIDFVVMPTQMSYKAIMCAGVCSLGSTCCTYKRNSETVKRPHGAVCCQGTLMTQ